MNRWMLPALLVLAAAPAAASDVRLDSYRDPKNNEGLHNAYRMNLDGVKSGLIAYNVFAKRHGGQPVFCMPDDLAMTAEQAEEIMLRRAEKTSAQGSMLVSILLLYGLRDTYPCEKNDTKE